VMQAKLVERGRKFISLQGMKFKSFSGLAFAIRKTQYVKIHVDGRIMIDPVTFRRVNPNYVVSAVKTRDTESGDDDDNDELVERDSRGDDDDETSQDRLVMDKNGTWHAITRQEEKQKVMEVNPLDNPDSPEPEPRLPNEDDLLTASPVVLGWAFTEKLWLEFPVSAVGDIVWNSTAFDSLVLPEEQKSIIRALVQFHTSTFDDVIVGKGKGLITVLHGPPGVGKTLTAESISEHLHRPLYTVSSGELGTNPTQLERTLQQILTIATTWNAVLLLDEADIFLEKRTMTDLHRNALVSIFLRLLEYFRGILFLTTNRVETFDDAFQSRIHVALKYPELDYRARLKIWNMFINMTEHDIGDEEVHTLAKRGLNGRQIKNVVRTAQALASSKGKRLGVKEVGICLDTAEGFEDELKGRGRVDNMHAYA
jgi:adenylate kinase family enzyme